MASTDILTDLTTGDRLLVNGDWALVDGRAAVAQWIAASLRTWVGEWYLNIRYGTDYRGVFFVKPFSRQAVSNQIKRVVNRVEGVLSIEGLTLELNRATRHLRFSMTVRTIEGDIAFEAGIVFAEGGALQLMFVPEAGIWPG